MDESCLLRLERETLKFMEIENIFYRLRHAEQISPIYTLFRSIFKKEHEFTIQVKWSKLILGTHQHGQEP